jgi:uncharacterized protein YjbJ (UPF0337 family)
MAVGGRGTSKTYGASKLHFLKNTFYPNYSTRHASATLEQAAVCQGYLEKFSSDPSLRSILTSSPSKKEARWKNGSQWRIVTGSFKGVCLSPWTSINTDKGTIPIKKIFESKQEYKALSFNTTTNEFEYKKIVGKHNNGADGVFYKINTQYQLTSVSPAYTANHEVYVSGNVKKQVGELTSEDSILVKGYKFSKDQEQVLLGTLLGDSSIDKSGRLTYAHGLPQEYYGDWKAQVFSEIIQRKYTREGGFGTECKFYRFFKTIELLKLRDTMYPQGKKVVTYEYLCKLNFLGLAVWFMDDGHRSKNSITFNTQGFDDESVDIIVKFFNDNGFNAKKKLDKNKQPIVVFDVKSSVKFLRHIAFYIHYDEEGKNKQWVAKPIKSNGREELHEVKVTSVDKTELLDTTRYDITVEDNHNYVLSNGQLVSNSGQHPRALYLDEIETWKIEDIEQTWAVPLAGDGHVAGWHGFSTRQRAFGAANWLTEVAADRGIKTYTWTIFETLQRCKTCVAIDQHPHGTDEQRQSACNLWEDCHGCRGTKSTGWVQLAHAQELKSTMSRSSWLTQALCEKPSTHGLVLHNFEHMGRIQGGNLTAFTYQENLPLYCCHDPAEGAESCLYYIQIIDDCVYVFDELVQNPCANTSITKMAFYEHNIKRGYKDPTLIIVDPRKTDAIEDWKLGISNGEGIGRSYKAVGSPMDRAHGGQQIADNIEYLRTLIQDGNNVRRLYVNHKQCPKLIQGIKEYHYPMNNNNEQTSDTPSKEYSDRIDPLRYFAQWHKTINSRNAKNVFRIH